MPARSAERIQFLADVIVSAVEGGTGYWAAAGGYKHDEPAQTQVWLHLEDDPDRKPEFVGIEAIALGIGRIKRDDFQINGELKKLIVEASAENDGALIDADAADVIVQAAIFGEIVYG